MLHQYSRGAAGSNPVTIPSSKFNICDMYNAGSHHNNSPNGIPQVNFVVIYLMYNVDFVLENLVNCNY